MVFHQAWQIAALTIVVALIIRIAVKNRPHLAHALWILVLIKCITPPLWGHSLGVFSQIQAWTTPTEVSAAEVRPPVQTPVDSPLDEEIYCVDLVMPEDANQEIVSQDVWPDDAEVSFDEEAQRQRNAEEQADLASLRFNDSAFEIPPPDFEAETHAAEQTASPVIDQLPSLLFGGFLIGAIITLTTMVIRCVRCLRQIRLHRTTEFDDVLRDRIKRLARQLRIRRIPNIIVSDVLFGPAVLGLLRHTIVLPRCLFEVGDTGRSFLPERTSQPVATCDQSTSIDEQHGDVERTIVPCEVRLTAKVLPGREDLLKQLPGSQDLQFLDPILAHELLHIRRGDLQTGTLQAIVQSLWWFHPAVWFANRWLSREAERCCDEQVIAELGCTPAHYARSLLSVIECKHRLQPIPVFPGMKPVEITSQRMERIMSLKNGLKKRTPIWCWLMIAALAVVVLPGAVAKSTPDEVKPDSNSDSRLVGTFKNDDQREVPAVTAPPEIAENKPASKENSPEARFVLVSYPVADLVVFRQPAKANTDRFVAVDSPAPQPPGTAASPAVVPEDSADQVEKNPLSPLPQPKDNSRNFKADFAPLTELIKASVQPESWDPVGPAIIGVDEKTLSLVIRHTQTAHDEICKLIVQLRKADDHMISISSQIVKLTDVAQVQWLGTQCSLHSLDNGIQWALLPKQRSEVFTRELLGQKPVVLSAPKVMTISGQTATIQVGQTNPEDDTTIGVRMELTPHLLPDTKVFRLQHAVQIGKLSAEVLLPVESLVGSGQSLLLLLDAASENKEPEVPTSKYLLLITPEYVPMVEEAENVAAPQADNKAEANP